MLEQITIYGAIESGNMKIFIILRTQVGYNGESVYGDKVYLSKRKVTSRLKKLRKEEGEGLCAKYTFRYVEKEAE